MILTLKYLKNLKFNNIYKVHVLTYIPLVYKLKRHLHKTTAVNCP